MDIQRCLCAIVVSLLSLAGVTDAAQDGLSQEAQHWLNEADRGNAEAQFRLAAAYDSGDGAPRDRAQALRWYRTAAEQGYAEAQNSLGSLLQDEKLYSEALPWFEKAMSQGHAHATNNVAYLYDLGLGVKQDRQKAFLLYMQAAELGWAESMWNIANMYGAGQLGPPDMAAACVWTLRARRYVEPLQWRLLAQLDRVLPQLPRHLPPAAMEICRKQADAWSPSGLKAKR